jgi:hypothetical protein
VCDASCAEKNVVRKAALERQLGVHASAGARSECDAGARGEPYLSLGGRGECRPERECRQRDCDLMTGHTQYLTTRECGVDISSHAIAAPAFCHEIRIRTDHDRHTRSPSAAC